MTIGSLSDNSIREHLAILEATELAIARVSRSLMCANSNSQVAYLSHNINSLFESSKRPAELLLLLPNHPLSGFETQLAVGKHVPIWALSVSQRKTS